eukprot:2243906-Pleurochrysis_carterae.AAC.4
MDDVRAAAACLKYAVLVKRRPHQLDCHLCCPLKCSPRCLPHCRPHSRLLPLPTRAARASSARGCRGPSCCRRCGSGSGGRGVVAGMPRAAVTLSSLLHWYGICNNLIRAARGMEL